nr:DNA mismatch repair protein MSH4 [Tanacetum cinerariifolium]
MSYTSYQNTQTLLYFYDHNVLIPPLSNDALSHLVDSSIRKVTMLCAAFDDTRGRSLSKASLLKNLPLFVKIPITCSITYAWLSPLLLSSGLKLTKVTFNGSFGHVSIDATSVLNLDLIDPLHCSLLGTSDKNRSLFQILKTTRTIEGTRLICANLLQPLKDTINARLDYLNWREGIDEDVLHARVHFVARTQQFFAVKAGIDGFLDIERRSFCDTSTAIHNLANKYRED